MSKAKPGKSSGNADATLTKLVRQLADAEAALQAHLGDQVDAVLVQSGQPLLLTQAQQKLIDSETMQRVAAETQKGILDAIPAHIALLDKNGVIMVVNESWRKFGQLNGLDSPGFGVGTNYLQICDAATGECAEEAPAVGQGIRSVLEGKATEYSLEYPCHTPTQQKWFRLMVTPVSATNQVGVVVMHIDISERKLAEIQLREQEQQQRQLARRLIEAQAVAKVGSWETDLKTMAVTWSEETHHIFGTDPEKFQPTHESFLARVHANDRARVDQAFVESLKDDIRHSIEHQIVLPDGAFKTVEETWQVMFDDDGVPFRAVGTCQDITRRKQIEHAAEEALRFSETLLESSPLAIITYKASGEGVMANAASARVLGAPSVEAVKNQNFRKIKVWQETGLLSVALEVLATGQAKDWEIRSKNSFGREIWLHCWLVPVTHNDEPYLLGFFDDIMKRKMAEEERDRLFNLSVDLLCVAGFDGRFQQVNPAWTRCLGWTKEELTARPMIEIIHPEDHAATLATRSRIQQGIPSVGFENRYRHKDGSYRWLSWNVFPLPDTRQVFAVARDVTDQKTAAEKIYVQLVELERWRNVTLGREDRILSLKQEVNQLLAQAGQPPRYGNPNKLEPPDTANPPRLS